MKTIYFNIQSKGGTGKSMLTYLQALKHEANPKVAFVDLDSSTRTSTGQLKFLTDASMIRLFTVDMFDHLRKIERERLLQVLEALNSKDFDEIFIDFGAPESEQLPALFSVDFSMEEFKEFEKELGAKFVFNVLLCGGTSYQSTFYYLKKICEIINGRFDVNMYLNELTFQNYPTLVDELMQFARRSGGVVKSVIPFGNIYVDRASGQVITENVRKGVGLSGYHSFASKTIIKREISKI